MSKDPIEFLKHIADECNYYHKAQPGAAENCREVQGTVGHSKALEGITAFHLYRLLMNHRRV